MSEEPKANLLAPYGISPEREQAMWKAHRREQLLFWAALPFDQKMEMVEEMCETAEIFARSRATRAETLRVAEIEPTAKADLAE